MVDSDSWCSRKSRIALPNKNSNGHLSRGKQLLSKKANNSLSVGVTSKLLNGCPVLIFIA